jgi:hypothetical protein
MSKRLAGFARLAIAIAVGLLFSIPGHAVVIVCTIPPIVIPSAYVTYSPGPPPVWGVGVDPTCSVSGFQLDLLYDSSTLNFVSGSDTAPFTGSAPTVISPGDVQFSGTTSSPVPGDVYIFTAEFQAISGNPAPDSETFTIMATGSDFVTEEGGVTIGPANIQSLSVALPEPSTLLLLASGLGLLSIGRRRLLRRRDI